MAKIREVNQSELDNWLKDRPQVIKDLVAKVPPGRLYRMKTTNHRVFPYAYMEDGTLQVVVSGEYNLVAFERRVFGINPDDLEECDLPAPGEPVGAQYKTDEEIAAHIARIRGENN